MIILYFASIALAFIYIFIITNILTSWNEIEEWTFDESFKPETRVSVIIPYRNEESQIKTCLSSVIANSYPKSLYEVIPVNDHSTDMSESIVSSFFNKHIKPIALTENEGKKNAVDAGIRYAEGGLIVTLDGDCTVEKDWLINLVSFYEYHKSKVIVGMVDLEGDKNPLEHFQILDTCGTMAIHASGIKNKSFYLGNGANLAFEKQWYLKHLPYMGNEDYASGDDIFLINKAASEDPSSIGFLKSKPAVVHTRTLKTWRALINQRMRWATKHGQYAKGNYNLMSASIWLLCVSIFINFILIPFTGALSLFIALTQLLIKGIMDYLFLANLCSYFGKSEKLKLFFPSFFIHIGYIILAGILAILGKRAYEWKGRRVK